MSAKESRPLLVLLFAAGLPVLTNAQLDASAIQARADIATGKLAQYTDMMSPQALQVREAMIADRKAEVLQKSLGIGRKLLQVQSYPASPPPIAYSPPPPPNQLKLPDGSTCCPTKPVLSAIPPLPPNNGDLSWPKYMNAACQFYIRGNNQTVDGIVSASINCVTVDGTDVLMYLGANLLKFAANFKGVYAIAPQPGTLNLDPNAIFLIQAGGIQIFNSQFTNIAIGQDFPLITITEGTSPVLISGSYFANITTCVGNSNPSSTMCLPVIAATQPTTYVEVLSSYFDNNNCFSPTICHSGTLYITNRASSLIRATTISHTQGHFGAAIMITDGANAIINTTVILASTVNVFGSFGAIWLSACQAYDPPFPFITGYTVIDTSYIAGNYVNGSGAGLAVSDCPNTLVRKSIFYSNVAALVGGGIDIRGNSPGTTIDSSFFLNNVAVNYFGGAVGLEPCSNTFYISNSVFSGNAETISGGITGCDAYAGGNGNVINTNPTANQLAIYNSVLQSIPGLAPLLG